ncbi:MAG: peptidylprolyl isomerase [Blastocatellia bacterium]|nr:peptidylprolyl isomerase [Blastocatellia bacterium]MCS7156638.1 peptidylprolyl isomerase [Blastocatellia bacterium]MCX7751620.1 peptidylprolyl isomerase [Blastocatellia bacterium]MDW8168720.1 peptidylprolyl isomerase [Acidobacteriota bacterium]MDW8256986.1 peptidylprolyl isomerase [Acidobacteriota bacterium]
MRRMCVSSWGMMSFALALVLVSGVWGQQRPSAPARRAPGLYAIFETSMGRIVCRLFEQETPKTVANFVGLAEGTKEHLSPRTGRKIKKRFYDGLMFHRVIPNFIIQSGDPTATGRYTPGYTFEDEIRPNLKFDKPGRLAMANRGPNTNGSQFFITVAPAPHLNGKHTIFGEVVEGLDVARRIANVPRDATDKPINPVLIQKVIIERVK